MSINPWCDDFKKGDNPQVLTGLLLTDQAKFDRCCKHCQDEQTNRNVGHSYVPKAKLWSICKNISYRLSECFFCTSEIGRSLQVLFTPNPTLRLYVCTPPTNAAWFQRDPSQLTVLYSHESTVHGKPPHFQFWQLLHFSVTFCNFNLVELTLDLLH